MEDLGVDKSLLFYVSQFSRREEVEVSKNWLWITSHFEYLVAKYGGKYVAVANEKIIAEGNSRKEVKDIVKKKKIEEAPFIMLIPKEESLECLL